MVWVVVILCVLLIVFGLYCYLISPNPDRAGRKRMYSFETHYIAHRGFFHPEDGVTENSLPAFARAVEKGFGIELDVQLSRDGQVVVFHDGSLKRMCGVSWNLRDLDYDALRQLRLRDSEERIPLLTEVLKVIDGRVPLIIEVKHEGDVIATSKKTAEIMDHYSGEWCMESFDPRSLKWFRDNRPSVPRGQLSTDYGRERIRQNVVVNFLLSNLMLNVLGRPDFIAYNHKYAGKASLVLCRKLFHPVMAAWTIKNRQELIEAEKNFSVFIFDSFDPDRQLYPL